MQLRWIAAVVAVAACAVAPAEKRKRPRVEPGAPLPWATIEIESEQDALWVWVQLDPTGRDYEAKLESIPAKFREPMALALLREGRLECEVIEEVDGCGNRTARFVGPTDDSDIDDGCLRRKLAAWAIRQVDAEKLHGELQGPMIYLAQLPLPERELHTVIVEHMAVLTRGFGEYVWHVEASGDEATADASVHAGMSRGDLVWLAEHGVDRAIDELLVQAKPDVIAAVVAAHQDPADLRRVRRETWRRVIREIQTMRAGTTAGDSTRRLLDGAIATIVAGGDCELAGEAGVVDRAGREQAATQEDWNYMACFWIAAQGAESRFLRDLVAAKGLTVKRTGDKAAPDETRASDASFEMPFADELPAALRTCTEASCPLPGTYIRFELRRDGKGRLEEIERYDAGGC